MAFADWTTLVPAQTSLSSEQARNGSKSVKFDFTLADGWPVNPHCQITPNSANVQFAQLGKDVWYGFSTYHPSWTPDDLGNGDIIWQFHGSTTGPCCGGPPPLALYVYGNTASYVCNSHATNSYPTAQPTETTLYSWNMQDDVGHWVDTVVQANYSYTNGYIRIWKKRATDTAWTLVVDYAGSTIYHCDAQTTAIGPYPMFGPYKWDWGNTTTLISERIMYLDEVRVGKFFSTLAQVAPQPAVGSS